MDLKFLEDVVPMRVEGSLFDAERGGKIFVRRPLERVQHHLALPPTQRLAACGCAQTMKVANYRTLRGAAQDGPALSRVANKKRNVENAGAR
jgi:hypothetical protein